jgi:glycosyl transferase family 25
MNKFVDNVYVINMDKDKQRLELITKECQKFNIKFERFTGIDATMLTKKEKSKYITDYCNNFCPNSIIGCAISHIKIYEDIINKGYKNALILEDDIYIDDDFYDILNKAFEELPDNYDILYLGFLNFINYKENNNKFKNIYIPKIPLGTHAYIISNKGCKKLFKYLTKNIFFHIDWIINFNMNKLNVYTTKKKIIYQTWNDSNNSNLTSFPKYINLVLNKYKINNDIPCTYFFNLSYIKLFNINITLWIIIFFIFGLINNKYLNLLILLYFLIDFDLIFFLVLFLGLIINIIIYKL